MYTSCLGLIQRPIHCPDIIIIFQKAHKPFYFPISRKQKYTNVHKHAFMKQDRDSLTKQTALSEKSATSCTSCSAWHFYVKINVKLSHMWGKNMTNLDQVLLISKANHYSHNSTVFTERCLQPMSGCMNSELKRSQPIITNSKSIRPLVWDMLVWDQNRQPGVIVT